MKSLSSLCLQRDQNRAQNKVFAIFSSFGSLVFFEIAYNDILQQCITSSRGKAHGKKLRPKRAKIRFFTFSQVQFISFPLNCIEW